MVPKVAAAIEELRQAFPDNGVEAIEDGHGGAHIIVHDIDLGELYRPRRSWIGFDVPYLYPAGDVYPHFSDPGLAREDEQGLGEGFGQATWQGRAATQISRRSNRWNPAEDSALIKLHKVLAWMRGR